MNIIENLHTIESLEHDYITLKKHIKSDEVDIYTIASVFVKNYGETGYQYIHQIIICIVCFITQVTIPILVTYDNILKMLESHSIEFCTKGGTWINRSASIIMCLFLILFYITKWPSFISHFIKKEKKTPTNTLTMILLKNLELYVSELFFNIGVLANLTTHCLNTAAGLIIIYYSVDCLDLVINCCVLYYFNDISRMFVNEKIKKKCLVLLESKHDFHTSDINRSVQEMQHENVSYRKWFDTYVSMFTFGFIITIIPILGLATFCALIAGVIYLPICHP